MPLYEFECGRCGLFVEMRPFAQSSVPATCPYCRGQALKLFPAVNLRSMRAGNRTAHERNERSAHAPHVWGSGCDHAGRPSPKAKKPGEKPALRSVTRPGSRPWMLGH